MAQIDKLRWCRREVAASMPCIARTSRAGHGATHPYHRRRRAKALNELVRDAQVLEAVEEGRVRHADRQLLQHVFFLRGPQGARRARAVDAPSVEVARNPWFRSSFFPLLPKGDFRGVDVLSAARKLPLSC